MKFISPMILPVARHIVTDSRGRFCSSLAIFGGYETPNRWALHPLPTFLAPIPFYPRTSSNPLHRVPDVSGTRRIPHAGVPSISIKDIPQQTAGLVVVEVANGRKAILTLTFIHSLSCGRPTPYVPRGHYFRFNGVATCSREKKKKKRGW